MDPSPTVDKYDSFHKPNDWSLPPTLQTRKPVGSPLGVRTHGMTTLHEPKEDTPLADVVFVHGLQGHPQRTWQQQPPPVLKPPRKRLGNILSRNANRGLEPGVQRSVYWPQDLLPCDHNDIRVLTYGYDSHISHFFTGPTNKNNIFQHGHSFLEALARKREGCAERPIIFVAHSLGGLVVKQALIESRKQIRHLDLQRIFHCTSAVIFFGTPHRGSPAAGWGLMLESIAKSCQFDTNSAILRDLHASLGSSKLDELMKDFSDVVDESNINLYTLQEGVGITGFGPFNGKVVPDWSSSFESRRVRSDTIAAHHRDMCRFITRDDDGYGKFLGFLRIDLRAIDEERQRTQRLAEEQKRLEEEKNALLRGSKEEQQRQEIVSSLEYVERHVRETQVAMVDGKSESFDWVWRAQDGSSNLFDWLSSEGSVFWISGKPGSGKSTLMDYISGHELVQQTLSRHGRRLTKWGQWTILRFFFDFRAGVDIGNNFDGFLRTLLIQLVENLDATAQLLQDLKQKFVQGQHRAGWHTAELRAALRAFLKQSRHDICIFVDGLDEYEGDMLELIMFLKDLASSSAAGPPYIKLCVASRPEPFIEEAFKEFPNFKMQYHNLEGIRNFVSTTLRHATPIATDGLRLRILSQSIAERAEGVFLWARFAIYELVTGFVRGGSMEQLLDQLKRVPPDLEKIFDRIFKRLERADKAEASIIFRLVAYAEGAVSIQNLLVAIDQFKGNRYVHRKPFTTADKDMFERRIRAISGGLLEIVPNDGVGDDVYSNGAEPLSRRDGLRNLLVRLVHKTVRTYMGRHAWLLESSSTSTEIVQPQLLWLRICVQYIDGLLETIKQERASGVVNCGATWLGQFGTTSKSVSFTQYAVQTVFDYAKIAEVEGGCSSFPDLQKIMVPDFLEVHWIISLASPCKSCHKNGIVRKNKKTGLSWCPLSTWPGQLSFAAVHELELYCQDLRTVPYLLTEKWKPNVNPPKSVRASQVLSILPTPPTSFE